mmetsp:Transcript_13216/g.37267  ORF Transcript_13216/g.37267 Transcript_13216/m.37267 type:complete len:154 (-) Transcript_13216:1938-2399(-)
MKWRPCLSSHSDLPPPSPRSGHVSVAVYSQQWATEFVVIHGGLGNKKEFLSDTVVLDTGDEHWMRPVPVGDLNPGARAFHAGCAVGSRVYIFGGSWSPRNRYQADLWCLDTVTQPESAPPCALCVPGFWLVANRRPAQRDCVQLTRLWECMEG